MVKTIPDFKIEDVEKVKVEEGKQALAKKKADCKAKGGTWDEETQSCIIPVEQQLKDFKIDPTLLTQKPEEIEADIERPKDDLKTSEYFTDQQGNLSGITLPGGKTFLGLSPEEVNQIAQRDIEKKTPTSMIQPVGTAQRQLTQQLEAQRLGGTLGEFNQLGVSPTGLNFGEAAKQGLISGIPRALSIAGGAIAGGAAIGAGVGAAGLGAAPVTVPAGAVIGGIVGFVGSISGSIISNFKSQRTDTTNAQKRVLDEGKQNLNDWATLAASDPANRATYVARFNQQLALIDQAYRQMKLDTSRDVAKFETALPDLAEFEAFYMAQGERDFLMARMRNSLGVQQESDLVYQMAELSNRRKS